jgi:hypothetical protein
VKPLYNVPLFSANDWELVSWEKKHAVLSEPYRSAFMKYVNACRKARDILLHACPKFVEIAKHTCEESKKTNVMGSAMSHLLQTVEDIALEATRLFFDKITNENRHVSYELKALIYAGMQLQPASDVKPDQITQHIVDATSHVRQLFGWTRFKLEQKPITCVYIRGKTTPLGYKPMPVSKLTFVKNSIQNIV